MRGQDTASNSRNNPFASASRLFARPVNIAVRANLRGPRLFLLPRWLRLRTHRAPVGASLVYALFMRSKAKWKGVNGSKGLKNHPNAASTSAPGRCFAPERACTTSAEQFELNVIFTDREATAAAVKISESLARDLAACIRLRAGIVVPLQLPLDQPLVSVEFFGQVLREVVGQPEPDGPERLIHLYVCRDWVETLLDVLTPNSVAVMGVRKSWFPKTEIRLARRLRTKGIRVLLVDPRQADARPDLKSELPSHGIALRWASAWRLIANGLNCARPRTQSKRTREVH